MNRKLFMQIKRSLFIGFAITILTPLLSTYTVTDLEQLQDLKFGFPLKFISQQSGLMPLEQNLPLRLHIGLPQENLTQLIIGNFMLSLIANTLILFLVNILWILFQRYRNSVRN